MGKNSVAKKPRKKTIDYKAAREKGLRSVRLALCVQMGAVVDAMNPTTEQMIQAMNLTKKYNEHLEKHVAKLNDMAATIFKETGIDIRIMEEDNHDVYSIADLTRHVKPMDVERAIRKGWLEAYVETDEQEHVKMILRDRRSGEKVVL